MQLEPRSIGPTLLTAGPATRAGAPWPSGRATLRRLRAHAPTPGVPGDPDSDVMAIDAMVAPMRASDLFRSLDAEAAERLAAQLVRRRYQAGEVVFHQDDPGHRLHVIETGTIRIGMGSVDGREGTLAVLGPGAVFGELILLGGAYRSATAVAMVPTTTVTLDRAMFAALAAEDPSIRLAVLGGVARWLRRLTDHITELHFLDLRGRLIATLVRMARDVGPGPGPVLLPPLSQADLASLVAGTRQRVNVALRELVRDGLICHDGRRITVCDVESLARQLRW